MSLTFGLKTTMSNLTISRIDSIGRTRELDIRAEDDHTAALPTSRIDRICRTNELDLRAQDAPVSNGDAKRKLCHDAHLLLGAPREMDHRSGIYPCEGLDPTLDFGVKLPVLEEGRRHGGIHPEPRD
ncbi:MAG: hypothetical protein L6R36_009255 [Xanthoria steineri]|nr:MAG: hypothetical protein L6R36_009255 [Xanthoria steineri]